jgi:hypothetical protein
MPEKRGTVQLTTSGGVAPSVILAIVVAFALGLPHTIAGPRPIEDARIDCKLAQALSRSPNRPVWYPFPQPAGYVFHTNADAPPAFAGGLKWTAGGRYFWLDRIPGGANLGDPGAKRIAVVFFENIGQRIEVLRLSFNGPRLYAQWPTTARYPDTTALVSKHQSLLQFTRFLRSLRRIRWPASCP